MDQLRGIFPAEGHRRHVVNGKRTSPCVPTGRSGKSLLGDGAARQWDRLLTAEQVAQKVKTADGNRDDLSNAIQDVELAMRALEVRAG